MTPAPEPATDEASMALCAIRYCIGRQSYIVASGCRWAREWGRRSAWVRSVVIQDLDTLVRRIDVTPPGRERMGWLGADSDERAWREVLAELRAMEAAL